MTPSGVLTRRGLLRVPQIAVLFWVIKALATAFGESTSDWMVHAINPVLAVLIGFAAFCAALAWQLTRLRYQAVPYWLAVAMVGVFGTMAADVMHVGFHIPYQVTTVLYAVALAAIFFIWWKVEGTLSIHAIETTRREIFYWLAVAATFAMGTALGDLTAYSIGLGYGKSIWLFAILMIPPLIGWRLGWSPVLMFWWAYVMTRPLGASVADWLGKPQTVGGRGFGSGLVSIVLALLIGAFVAYLALTKRDVQVADPDRERTRS